jgi:hypothetical protein
LHWWDSMRCRLLASLWTSSASASNPAVEFIRSRKINFDDSGSSLTNKSIASSRSASSKARPGRFAHAPPRFP